MAGMLRIHFSDRDFRYTQLTKSADPVWEVILGLHVLATPLARLPARLRPWRRRAARRLRDGDDLRAAYRLLRDLAPANAAYFPDFLTPAESEEGLAAALEALRATPGPRLLRELHQAARHHPLPPWTRRLAAGDRTLLAQVAEALHQLHARLIVPEWTAIEPTIAADRERHLDALADGLPAVLATLEPFTWRDSVLCAPYPVDHDLWLRGRGVRLVPSFLCHTTPIAIADPNLPPVVVYPVRAHPTGPDPAAGPPRALGALLGTARSRVLDALTVADTTGAVAARLGMPASTVSGHLSVLRAAGLVSSVREGTRVIHRLTGRGRHLLGR